MDCPWGNASVTASCSTTMTTVRHARRTDRCCIMDMDVVYLMHYEIVIDFDQ